MQTLILHLSDMHIRKSDDRILTLAEPIANCLAFTESKISSCIVIVTGDIAFSGKEEEYEAAAYFFLELEENLMRQLDLDKINYVFCPGNHDCDFDQSASYRDLIINSIKNSPIKSIPEDQIAQCVIQDNFFNFLEQFKRGLVDSGKLAYRYLFSEEGYDVEVYCYNSAWMSMKTEKQGELIFPIQCLEQHKATGNIRIAVMHHPFPWFQTDNARSLRRHIEDRSDLILTGHEHESSVYIKKQLSETTISEYVEGCVLQGQGYGSEIRSEFLAIIIDVNEFQQKSYKFSLDGDIYREHLLSDWNDIGVFVRRSRSGWELNPTFEEHFLLDPGTGFTHSRKAKLLLSDLYVEPYIREVRAEDAENRFLIKPQKLSRFYFSSKSYNRVAISCDEKIGKTTSCKALFKLAFDSGALPILINGEDIKDTKSSKLNALIKSALDEQYANLDIDKLKSTRAEDRILIIDSFHLSVLNQKAKASALKELVHDFGRVFVLTDNISEFELPTPDREATDFLASFHRFDLLGFGHELREEMIIKWLTIGQELTLSEEELLWQSENIKRVLDALMGKRLLPSYPFFILSILQQVEANTDLESANGSYGYIYSALITQALYPHKNTISIDTAHFYLSLVAEKMYSTGSTVITSADLFELHHEYCRDYRMQLNYDKVILALVNANLLETYDKGEHYRFRYKYCYYFFVARYLSSCLTTEIGRERLSELADNLHSEEHANILIFLAYFSKEQIIIDKMLDVARGIFADHQPCDFNHQQEILSRLQFELPTISISEDSPSEVRRRINVLRDENEDHGKQVVVEHHLDKNEFGELIKLNIAFKTIQILGQVLKSFAGSIPGTIKFTITNECYLLGLRSITMVTDMITADLEGLVIELAEKVFEEEDSPLERQAKASKFVAYVMETMSFGLVKRISGSIGSPAIRQTLDDVLKDNTLLSNRIIDLSVRFDHLKGFPIEQMDEVLEQCDKNIFARMLVSHLFVDHLYRFYTNLEVKQRYAKRLGLDYNKIKLLEQPPKKKHGQ